MNGLSVERRKRPAAADIAPPAGKRCRKPDCNLSDEIVSVYEAIRQTERQYAARKRLRACIERVLRLAFPKCSVHLVGSSSNGFGSNSADADMCLMLSDNHVCQRTESHRILRLVQKAFRRLRFFRFPYVIKAKVPILRFRDNISGVSVDLNLNNSAGILNTRLLKAYSRLDSRSRPLVLVAKAWAKHHGINDASQQTLSSYSIALMVIHVLQCVCMPAILPVLDPDDSNSWPTDWQSENADPLGILLLRFLRYFAEEFDFEKSAISVRKGTVISRDEFQGDERHLFCIEEPYERTNVARCIFNISKFDEIKAVFYRSFQQLQRRRSLRAILPTY